MSPRIVDGFEVIDVEVQRAQRLGMMLRALHRKGAQLEEALPREHAGQVVEQVGAVHHALRVEPRGPFRPAVHDGRHRGPVPHQREEAVERAGVGEEPRRADEAEREVGFARGVLLEHAVAAPFAVVAFPIDAHAREAGLEQQLVQLG